MRKKNISETFVTRSKQELTLMQINLFDQHYIGQLIIQCWLKTLSLASEDKNDAESRNFCSNGDNIKRIILMTGL